MPTLYHGANGDIYLFDNLDSNYLAQHNTDLQTLIDHTHSNNPIHGTTAIQPGTITAASIAAGTITSNELAALSVLPTLANNSYYHIRNNANNADLDVFRANTSDKFELNIDVAKLRLGNNISFKGATAAAADLNLFKVNVSDQWEFLNTAYSQSILPKTTTTYDVGGASNIFSKGYFTNLRIGDYTSGTNFYTSGTFSPNVAGGSSTGSGTINSSIGRYVAIGHMVFVYFRVDYTGHTGTGDLQITNMPFTAENTSGMNPKGVAGYAQLVLPASCVQLMSFVTANTTYCSFFAAQDNASGSIQQMDASAIIEGTMFYWRA